MRTTLESVPNFPKRLLENESTSAGLIRASLGERGPGPTESRSWRLLGERSRARQWRPAWALAFGGALMAASILCFYGVRSEPAISIGAEPWTKTAAAEQRVPPADVVPRPPAERPAATPEPPPSPKAEPRSLEEAGDPARCATLARDGRYDSAADCYDRIARGRGMAAELALYEKARLESNALARGELALATLEEHGRRFPRGVLAIEVGMTRIELLIRVGRADAALAAIEQALQGPLGKERTGDLLALQGDLLSTRGDCKAAVLAFAGARKAGVHDSRLESGEKRCSGPAVAENPLPAEP